VGGASAYMVSPDGARIAWRVDGPSDAPAVALCTMATAAMSVWDGLAAALCDRWRVVRHDRRGEGDSDPGAPDSHSFATYARDAAGVLDAAGVDRAHVCGMAFGARVAVRLALDMPSRVSSLVLFDATGAPPAPEAERRAGNQEAARLREAAGLPRTQVDRRWFERRDPAGAGLAALSLKGAPAWTPGLGAIMAPTLIACGEQDPNIEGARRMAREIPNARFEAMPMTGHGSIVERPDLVVAHLRSFLESVEAARGGESA
jgi:3-oxoadipate enol-lactonase